jgi:hypothetical protein
VGRYAHTYMYMYMIHGCAVEEGSQAKRRSVQAKKSEGEFEGLSFEIRALSGLRVVV